MLFIHQFPDWTRFRFDSKRVLDALGRVRFLEGRLDGILDICGNRDFENALIVKDIAANFAIDNHPVDEHEVETEVSLKARSNSAHIKNYIGAIANSTAPLTQERLLNWQNALTHALNYRTTPSKVCYEGTSLQFQGPEPERLRGEMENFLNWFEDSSMDGTIKAAIAHFWMITLRPFNNGNGRLARTISTMQLCRGKNATHLQYALNVQINEKREEYFAKLNKAQCGNGDITEWILWFLQQVESAVQASCSLLEANLKQFRFQKRHSGIPTSEREQALIEAALSGKIPPEFTAKDAAAFFGTSHDTALREIQSLIAKGLVAASAKGGRSSKYSIVE